MKFSESPDSCCLVEPGDVLVIAPSLNDVHEALLMPACPFDEADALVGLSVEDDRVVVGSDGDEFRVSRPLNRKDVVVLMVRVADLTLGVVR